MVVSKPRHRAVTNQTPARCRRKRGLPPPPRSVRRGTVHAALAAASQPPLPSGIRQARAPRLPVPAMRDRQGRLRSGRARSGREIPSHAGSGRALAFVAPRCRSRSRWPTRVQPCVLPPTGMQRASANPRAPPPAGFREGSTVGVRIVGGSSRESRYATGDWIIRSVRSQSFVPGPASTVRPKSRVRPAS